MLQVLQGGQGHEIHLKDSIVLVRCHCHSHCSAGGTLDSPNKDLRLRSEEADGRQQSQVRGHRHIQSRAMPQFYICSEYAGYTDRHAF